MKQNKKQSKWTTRLEEHEKFRQMDCLSVNKMKD